MVGISSSGLKFQYFSIRIFKHGSLGIGGFLGAFLGRYAKDAAHGLYFYWMFVLVKSPPRHIKLMRSLISGIPVSGIPVPVPIVVSPFFVIGPIGSRSQPKVVI